MSEQLTTGEAWQMLARVLIELKTMKLAAREVSE